MQYKSYKNLIIMLVIAAVITGFIVITNTDFEELLLKTGFYDTRLTILNTADVHGQILFDDPAANYLLPEKTEVIMGLPLIASLVQQIKTKRPEAILLDSGDLLHGTNEALINQGEAVVKIVDKMPYTAIVPGNHDFNYGLKRLKQTRDEFAFPVLASNIYQDNELVFNDYIIINVKNIRVGIFGLTTQDAFFNANYLEAANLEIKNPLEEARRVMDILKEKADVIILVSHLGMENDYKIIDAIDGIDLVLCGHYHMLTEKALLYKGTYLAEAGDYARYLGTGEMYFKKGVLKRFKWRNVTAKKGSAALPALAAIAEEYHRIALKDSEAVIGKTTVFLDGIRNHVRSRETNLGNLLTDAMRKESGSRIVLMNGGGIRESIQAGDISLYKIGSILPFINSLVTVEMSGKAVVQALEQGVMGYTMSAANGGFLQVSGLKYTFDGSKPAGKRIVSVVLDNDEPLIMDKPYLVATNDYLYNGGDNYDVFKSTKLIKRGSLLKDVLIAYISEKKTIDIQTEDRITVLNKRY